MPQLVTSRGRVRRPTEKVQAMLGGHDGSMDVSDYGRFTHWHVPQMIMIKTNVHQKSRRMKKQSVARYCPANASKWVRRQIWPGIR